MIPKFLSWNSQRKLEKTTQQLDSLANLLIDKRSQESLGTYNAFLSSKVLENLVDLVPAMEEASINDSYYFVTKARTVGVKQTTNASHD